MTRYFILTLGLFLGLLLGLWLWLVSANPAPVLQPFSVAIAPSQFLTGRLYLPADTTAPVPALLLCHGVNSSKDTLAPLAQALARRQIAAVVFDFGGYGQSYRRPNDLSANQQDANAVLQWMRQHPQIGALGVGGHSMGGITALELAKSNPALRTTILLSIIGPATPTLPHNLGWAVAFTKS
ncbi:MAG: alpha/beta hydrolase [Leptolyngbya sp. RL_3_1]|nr:alpha/beta hydrolase [Leptolyngbya sp. RL_3_1]